MGRPPARGHDPGHSRRRLPAAHTPTGGLPMSIQSPVRILLVDRHALLAAGVRCALESARDIAIVGEARSDVHALALIGRVRPDVVLIDPLTSCAAGMAGIAEIRACHPEVAVVAMSDTTD